MPSKSRVQLENWLKTIDVKADRVLDIGGSQNPIKGRTKSWEVGDYKILDLAKPHEDSKRPDIVWDLNDEFHTIPKAEDELFDIAFCIEVAEYWYNPFSAINYIADLMKKDSILYISFHFLYPIHKPSGLDMLRYTEHGAIKLLEEAGFIIDEIEYRRMENGAGELGRAFGLEGMKPDKDYPMDKHIAQGYLIKAIKR